VADNEKSIAALNELIGEMGGMDVLVICAGITERNDGKLDWTLEKAQMNINAIGFAALAVAGFNYFLDSGDGTLVGISSVAMLRGNRFLPAYAASKAFMSIYLEGLRLRAAKLGSGMKVVDIRPGFVDTPMVRKDNLAFTVADLGRSVREMVRAIEKGKRVAYVPTFWSVFALPFRHIPNFIYEKI
jgi:short-subunit dehydrogenase